MILAVTLMILLWLLFLLLSLLMSMNLYDVAYKCYQLLCLAKYNSVWSYFQLLFQKIITKMMVIGSNLVKRQM